MSTLSVCSALFLATQASIAAPLSWGDAFKAPQANPAPTTHPWPGLAVSPLDQGVVIWENGSALVKYSPAGTEQWRVTFKVEGVVFSGMMPFTQLTPRDFLFDSLGNLYVFGSFKENLLLGKDTLVSRGGKGLQATSDVFYTKIDPTGAVVWKKQAGGTGADDIASVAVAKDGTFYMSLSLAMLDTSIRIDTAKTKKTGNVLFKFRTDGSIAWSTDNPIGGTLYYSWLMNSMATTASGDLVLTLYYDNMGHLIQLNGTDGSVSFKKRYDIGTNRVVVAPNGKIRVLFGSGVNWKVLVEGDSIAAHGGCLATFSSDGTYLSKKILSNLSFAATEPGPNGSLIFAGLLTKAYQSSVINSPTDSLMLPKADGLFVLKMDSAGAFQDPLTTTQTGLTFLGNVLDLSVGSNGIGYLAATVTGGTNFGAVTTGPSGYFETVMSFHTGDATTSMGHPTRSNRSDLVVQNLGGSLWVTGENLAKVTLTDLAGRVLAEKTISVGGESCLLSQTGVAHGVGLIRSVRRDGAVQTVRVLIP